MWFNFFFFFFSSRRRHTRSLRDWSSDVCSSDLPSGRHTMSVFAQYAPYRLAEGDWSKRREEIGDLVLAGIARYAPDVVDVVEERQVLGPPDIEARTGLTGGHIFQGECLPDQMWERRLTPRTPVPGLYL